MSYGFEDYDNFLQVVDGGNAGLDYDKNNAQLQGNSIVSNPSYSTSLSLSTDDEENVMNSFYDFDAPQHQQSIHSVNSLLSPHADYSSNSSGSPNEFIQLNPDLNLAFNNDAPFDLQPHQQQQQQQYQQIQQQLNQYQPNKVKVETRSSSLSNSSVTSPTSSVSVQPQQQKVKLANATPHGGSISKRGPKKEKSTHNMIEKRYRTNINDKIKALRDSVPALRVLVDSGEEDDHDDELDGLQPAKKLNKATILSKATEYIKHLEDKNEILRKENEDLKGKLYGAYNDITPNGSINAPFPTNDGELFHPQQAQQQQQNGSNYASKFLLGGLVCMAGAGLNDDLNHVDSRSLFSFPVFSFDQSGFEMLSKPLLIFLKVGIIVGVILNFIFPSIFNSKPAKSKEQLQQSSDDIRRLKTSSIISTFSLKPNHSNNDYVKSAIFRALSLKISYYNANTVVKSLVELYVDHLWTYLKQVKLDSNHEDYDKLRSILSLPNQQTIHNKDYLLRFIKADASILTKTVHNEIDFSVTSILYNMIHDTTTNQTLRNFLISSLVETDKSVPEIQKGIDAKIDDYNVELKTLFNPTETQIAKLKAVLEVSDIAQVESDKLLVLYSSIIQNLVFEKKDYTHVKRWFDKISAQSIDDFKLLGFTSLYTIILSLVNTPHMFEMIQHDKDFILKIEEMSGTLRIWLGNSNGSILDFKKRSKLIDYFVDISMKVNGMERQTDELKADA